VTGSDDKVTVVAFEEPGSPHHVGSKLKELLLREHIALSPAAEDCLAAAVLAYTADVRISRTDGFDGWTRDIHLHLAVRDLDRWASVAGTFVRMLSFLTGDHWELSLRRAPDTYGELSRGRELVSPSPTGARACLFSGGLDSYAGAIDELERSGHVLLVGHYRAGDGPTSKSQVAAWHHLQRVYGKEATPYFRIWIDPPHGDTRSSETTTRGRSVLFLALGAALAEAAGAESLLIPENGFISLNVPLHEARSGSLSTRTTHPYFLWLWRSILVGLGIPVTLELPFRLLTKQELIARCLNLPALQQGLKDTMSCAHPAAQRFSEAREPGIHCGYCVPCIIRRVAIGALGTDPTAYAVPDLRIGLSGGRQADLWSLRLAVDRYRQVPPGAGDLLRSGPLPVSDADIASLLSMYRRGIAELTTFLDKNS
jgi:7-cyano-7-deazaguanine synthase in queuosine biosynthesis